MSEQEQQGDSGLYTTPDVYQTQSGQDIYRTPDTDAEPYDTGGVFSGEQQTDNISYENVSAGDGPYDIVKYENDQPGNAPYGNGQYGNGSYGNNSYGNNPYGNDPYGNGQYGNNPYGGAPYGNSPYGNGQYGNGSYGNASYGNGQYSNSYGNVSQGNNPYGSDQYGNSSYGNTACGNNQYGNNQYGNNQYGNSQYGGSPYGGPAGPNQYGNGPYSPYAAPSKKKHTGLIIGIIITAVVLFLIALFALFYHAFDEMADRKMRAQLVEYNDYDLDEDYGYDDDYDHDYDDYGYDDDYDHDYDYDYDDDEYYTLHDDIKKLSYSVNWEYFEYDADNENVSIIVDYPEISGGHVPNLDKINRAIANEISVFTDYYEDEYSRYMTDDDSYFNAYASGYVTYMSEDVLSVVFSETVYTNYYNSAYLYCINIDMRDGVILENTDIISVDDDFSVDFRFRSDEQNGTIDEVDWMSDQEITELLTSASNLIIFYTPQGMEIGFNYDQGWVTVTYHDYRDYLKIF